MAFARHQFTLDARQTDGATLREHLQSVARQTGKIPEELAPVPLPPSMVGAWRAFVDLDGGRTLHAAGPNPITWPDIAAWCALTGTLLDPFDVAAIRAVDRAYLVAQHKK